MNTLRLALRMLSRDWRAGELTVLIAALVLAVASIGTVGFFADRVKGALTRQANLLLGADVLISGDRPLPESFASEAREARPRRRRRRSSSTAWCSVRRRCRGGRRGAGRRQGGRAGLSAARRDRAGRPGQRRRRAARPEFRRAAKRGPMRGSPRGSASQRGDALAVGDATLMVGAIVQQEPEVASGLLAIGPRLLINLDDVPATNLLQPGNRATYRLLVADVVEARRARSLSRMAAARS